VFATVVVVLAVVLTGASAFLRGQSRELPAPTGPNNVGRIELALNDTARVDPFATDGRTREIAVWLWYPTTEQPATNTAPYLPPAWADAVDTATGLISIFDQDRHAVQTSSLADAPLLGDAPVVVLLPGLGRAVPDYTALAEDLASHGYAVVGINMTGSSIVGFPDGHLVNSTAEGGIDPGLLSDVDAWYVDANRVIEVWVQDVAFVTSALAEDPPSIGPLDFSRVAYVGHSLGGAASFERCSQDEACVGAVDLDGTLFSDVRRTGMDTPGLVIRAERGPSGEFATRAAADFAHVADAGPVRILSLAGSTHNNFTDDGLLYGPLWGPLGVLGSIDGERSVAITRDVVGAFLNEVLLGARPAALDATISGYPELVGEP
jgi:pimeloyl-ACP methyl ester carboxylesterase